MTVGQPVDEPVDPQTEGGDGFATRCHEAVEIEQPLLGRLIEVGPLSALDLTEVELTQFGRQRHFPAPISRAVSTQRPRSEHQTDRTGRWRCLTAQRPDADRRR